MHHRGPPKTDLRPSIPSVTLRLPPARPVIYDDDSVPDSWSPTNKTTRVMELAKVLDLALLALQRDGLGPGEGRWAGWPEVGLALGAAVGWATLGVHLLECRTRRRSTWVGKRIASAAVVYAAVRLLVEVSDIRGCPRTVVCTPSLTELVASGVYQDHDGRPSMAVVLVTVIGGVCVVKTRLAALLPGLSFLLALAHPLLVLLEPGLVLQLVQMELLVLCGSLVGYDGRVLRRT